MWWKVMWLMWVAACGPSNPACTEMIRVQVPVDEASTLTDSGAIDVADGDEDGIASGDCAPEDPTVRPGVGEVPADGIDQDCDGVELCFVDADDDGFGTNATLPTPLALSCDEVPGRSSSADDCDDDDRRVHPKTVWHRDEDRDGLGDEGVVTAGCDPGPGWVMDTSDCDDGDPNVGPHTWYLDADSDGLGDPAVFREGCQPREGEVSNGADCDDDDPAGCEAAR